MPDIRLIALDLDGTLLDSDKNLPRENYEALARAAAQGVQIVPTTGRFYMGMPEIIRELPFVRYVIAINGAEILDTHTGEVLYRAEIALPDALRMMEYFDGLDVIYDCYTDDAAFMTRALWDKTELFAPNVHYLNMLRQLRQPVPELKAFLRERGHSIQKTQLFFRDPALRERELRELPLRFPMTAVSSSVVNNIEINHRDANKGRAVEELCRHLGFGPEQAMAFGDGLNDIPMLRAAGIGVAMQNADEVVKAEADDITASCDEAGVAAAIRKYLWEE